MKQRPVERRKGYYWVSWGPHLEIVYWDGGDWFRYGDKKRFKKYPPHYVWETPIEPPPE